jgi:hypothetical protein
VLDVLFRVRGERALADLLSDVRAAAPNGLHYFLASTAQAGSRQITMNFDDCLEQAGALGAIHVHGSFARDPSGASLGVTLARVERGLPPVMRDLLNDVLLAPQARLLVFLGYSGSDFFDVDPYLRGLRAGSLSGTVVLWIEHETSGSPEITTGAAADRRRQLAWLRGAGAQTILLAAATTAAIVALADNWEIEPPQLASPGPRSR